MSAHDGGGAAVSVDAVEESCKLRDAVPHSLNVTTVPSVLVAAFVAFGTVL